MLQVNSLSGFGGNPKILPEIYNNNARIDIASSSQNYTFSSLNIGPEKGSRYIIVGLYVEQSSTPPPPQTVTISGITCNLVCNINTTSGSTPRRFNVSYWITDRPVPTGTTADVTITNTSTCLSAGVFLASVYDIVSPIPISTLTDSSSPFSGNLNVPSYGILVAFGIVANTETVSWSEITELYEIQGISIGYLISTSGNPSQSVTMTRSGTSNFLPVLLAASFG